MINRESRSACTLLVGVLLTIGVIFSVLLLVMPMPRRYTVFAQESSFQSQAAPVSTPLPRLEVSPLYTSTNYLQRGLSTIATVISVGISPNGIVLNPNTRKAYVINSTNSNISVLDISADTHERFIDIEASQRLYWGIDIKPNVEHLYVSDNSEASVFCRVFITQ